MKKKKKHHELAIFIYYAIVELIFWSLEKKYRILNKIGEK